jgi:hypothetical protein
MNERTQQWKKRANEGSFHLSPPPLSAPRLAALYICSSEEEKKNAGIRNSEFIYALLLVAFQRKNKQPFACSRWCTAVQVVHAKERTRRREAIE